MIDKCLPLPNVAGRWTSGGRYPDVVFVQMSDGKRVAYDIRVEQPAPQERHEDHVGYRRCRDAE